MRDTLELLLASLRTIPQGLKPAFLATVGGTTEVVPFPSPTVAYSNPENALTAEEPGGELPFDAIPKRKVSFGLAPQ